MLLRCNVGRVGNEWEITGHNDKMNRYDMRCYEMTYHEMIL
jgi:hypothetical protein